MTHSPRSLSGIEPVNAISDLLGGVKGVGAMEHESGSGYV